MLKKTLKLTTCKYVNWRSVWKKHPLKAHSLTSKDAVRFNTSIVSIKNNAHCPQILTPLASTYISETQISSTRDLEVWGFREVCYSILMTTLFYIGTSSTVPIQPLWLLSPWEILIQTDVPLHHYNLLLWAELSKGFIAQSAPWVLSAASVDMDVVPVLQLM